MLGCRFFNQRSSVASVVGRSFRCRTAARIRESKVGSSCVSAPRRHLIISMANLRTSACYWVNRLAGSSISTWTIHGPWNYAPNSCRQHRRNSGEPTKPRSHYLYRVTRPVATKKIRTKSAGMIVELRSTGQQTVIPPSTHVDGELIEWETPGAVPAETDPDILVEAVVKLGDFVKIELGEKSAKKPKQKPERQPNANITPEPNPSPRFRPKNAGNDALQPCFASGPSTKTTGRIASSSPLAGQSSTISTMPGRWR